ncbi:MAG: hypothetical protein IPG56_06605 [Caulobacteraceae bacterium]|nr:hypothetical protein [Caulobacteraceae bacterium]
MWTGNASSSHAAAQLMNGISPKQHGGGKQDGREGERVERVGHVVVERDAALPEEKQRDERQRQRRQQEREFRGGVLDLIEREIRVRELAADALVELLVMAPNTTKSSL